MISLAFTGQDGTGKSTQAKRLLTRLRTDGSRVAIVHQYRPASWLGRMVGPAAKKISNRTMRARTRDVENTSSTAGGKQKIGLLTRLMALASLTGGLCRSVTNHTRNRRRDVLILDRYYPDEIIRVAHKFGYAPASGFWVLSKLVPAPTLLICFSVDSQTGWDRKKTRELTFKEYQDKVQCVQTTLDRIKACWNVVEIPIDGLNQDEVFERVWRNVSEIVATR